MKLLYHQFARAYDLVAWVVSFGYWLRRRLDVEITGWHTYHLIWQPNLVSFEVDGEVVHQTHLAPKGRLGLVFWIDNQFLSFDSEGVLEIRTLKLRNGLCE